jgi:hypothetical protein
MFHFRHGRISQSRRLRANEEYTEPYIPVNENLASLKFIPSINELSINLDSGSFQYTWAVYYQYPCTEQINSSMMSQTTDALPLPFTSQD